MSRPLTPVRGLSLIAFCGVMSALGGCASSGGYGDQNFSTQSLPPPRPDYGMANRPYRDEYLPPSQYPRNPYPDRYQPSPRPSAGMVQEPARPYGEYSLGRGEPPPNGQYQWNGNPNRISAGAPPPAPQRRQAQHTPPPPAPAPVAANGARTVTVKQGDTLYSLSRQHGVPVGALAEVNHLNGTAIRVGQTLVLPSQVR